jgi:protoheme IX farnesyltransferase
MDGPVMLDYLTLTKPRITLLVMATTAFGFKLAGGGDMSWSLLAGVGLASAACGTLNQWIERDLDGKMTRTAKRPLPAGRVDPRAALAYGLVLAASGLLLLDGLPRLLTAFTLVAYLLAYTPLKRLTPQSTWVGAAAGATPPLIGWAAATGTLPPQAWALFGIQFLWQIPHFLALFWLYREDYARAGFQVMPVVDPKGGSTAAQIALHSFTVLPASLAPSFIGMAGPGYGLAALALGTAYLGLGMRASWTMSNLDNRRLFLASLAYLPTLFTMLMIGGT